MREKLLFLFRLDNRKVKSFHNQAIRIEVAFPEASVYQPKRLKRRK